MQLPHADVECSNCHQRDAVFFQSQQRTAETGMVRVASYYIPRHMLIAAPGSLLRLHGMLPLVVDAEG